MKKLDEQIEYSKRRMQEVIDKYENCPTDEEFRLRGYVNSIHRWESYIKGLEDAKKFIEEGSVE